ncbi:MAG: response regulator [Bacteroidetes bacterium]|nr:response regulator [Bacteroidota bacterium]
MNRILVIDDMPDNVFILQDRLEREGYEILTAYDGIAGLEKAKLELPDLILLDIMMPGMSGLEVCEKLVNDDETKLIPIILVTALVEVKDLEIGLKVGAFDYIKKPFNKVELIARVRSALRFSESNKVMLEMEKIRTFAATVITANHEIKQPLTLINLSLAAIKRELGKDPISKEAINKKIQFIETAGKNIVDVLDKLSSIRRPEFTNYVNNMSMIDLDSDK